MSTSTQEKRRVVITGIGPITAAGIGVDGLWEGLRSKQSRIRQLDRFDASPFNCHIAAQADDFIPTDFMTKQQARRFDRFSQFSVALARLAIEDAGLDPSKENPDRVAVQMGSALGGIAYGEEQVHNFMEGGVRNVDPRVALTTFGGAASCNIAIEFGFTGANSTNAMSCASGAIALGEAWRLIRDGAVDVVIGGGVEAPLAQLSFGAFAIIRAMSTRNHDPSAACRPFDADRDGFVMGEGACGLILESEEHAQERGARIYAVLEGYGTTNDAYHMTAPRPDGSQAARAMETALRNADRAPTEVEYINAHASSTLLNDTTETAAIRDVFGAHAFRVPVTGTKPYYAHCLGASGAIEAGISCLVMNRGWIPPTLNHDKAEDGCDLNYVPTDGVDVSPSVVVSNSFGFGGINASLVFAAAK